MAKVVRNKTRLWKKRIAEYLASGESKYHFCNGKDFHESNLVYWMNKLGIEDTGTKRYRAAQAKKKEVTDKQYFAKDVTQLLNISNRTLCRYSVLLEKYGHKFGRNKYKHRIYFIQDIALLREVHGARSVDKTVEETVAELIGGKAVSNTQEVKTTQLVLPLLNSAGEPVKKSTNKQDDISTDKDDFLRIKIGEASIEVKPGFDPAFVSDVVKALSVNI
ncbi:MULTISPECIES: IS66 family insertion sequence element accessory protein TnpA [Bacillus cereus group]|uniref:IS66 family insertion sequence element accessory protein TnpA n=1 Tax=Bacillus cereus group TaxID=86661 RepID=UPI0022DEE624|nr:hypothetical protein [Bacillus cereus group sp. BcHK140]MCU5076864.1 hypothetical protein [Bacillus cereus]MDA1918138.1 hypothetical protein [Bacillus cereus group sp. BcHK140]